MKNTFVSAVITSLVISHSCFSQEITPPTLNEQLLEACWANEELRTLDNIQSLLDKGANVNYKGDEGYTPLHAACFKSKDTEIVSALINAGANVNAKADKGDTPLLTASDIRTGDGTPEVIIKLVEAGANVNVIDSWSEVTPLMRAVRNSYHGDHLGNASIESWLHKLNEKDFVDSYGSERLLLESIEHRRAWLKAAEKIIDAGADISYRNNSDTTRGRFDCGGSSAISIACLETNVDMVQLLIEKGADVNERNTFNGNTPIIYAASKDNKEIISLLLKNKAKIDSKNEDGLQAIHTAAGYHHFQNPENPGTIQFLVEAGADPNAKTKHGSSPLYLAVKKDKSNTIKMLIRLGADVNLRSDYGSTPLHAANSLYPYNFKILLNAGAKVNARNQDGKTCLSHMSSGLFNDYLSSEDFEKILDMLLENKLDINARDKKGQTPLFHCVENTRFKNNDEDLETLNRKLLLLLKAGADVSIKDKDGKTALDYATENPEHKKSKVYWTLHDKSFE